MNGGRDPMIHSLLEQSNDNKKAGMDDIGRTQGGRIPALSSPPSTTEASKMVVPRHDDGPPKVPTSDREASIRRYRRQHHHRRRRRQMPLEQWLVNRSRKGSITIDVGGQDRYAPTLRPWEPHVRSFNPKALTITETPTTANTTAVPSIDHNTTTTTLNTSPEQQRRRFRHLVRRPRSPMMMMNQQDPTLELTVSISPTSLFRLVQIFGVASAGALGAFGATLRLVAPMIVARRIISSIGYICYDYYNGRYIRTTYHKRLRNLEELEIPSALRACGRMGTQLFVMVVVGGVTRMLLQAAPCGLPDIVCRYWFGSVWVSSVLLAGSSVERWVRGESW